MDQPTSQRPGSLAQPWSPTVPPLKESVSLIARILVVVFCLIAAAIYRASVSVVPPGILENVFLVGLAVLLLASTWLARRSTTLRAYWIIPFAFFVFTVAGLGGDLNVSLLQRGFVESVLHQTPSSNNPLASTVVGTVLVQLFSTFCMVALIIVLTKASGRDLKSLYIDTLRQRWTLVVAVLGFLAFFVLAARGRTAAFFPTHNIVSFSRFLTLAPALVILVLCNGLREELWFRGLFLKQYERFLSPWMSNVLAAAIFTAFHVQVQYALQLLPFLGYTALLGLAMGYLMQKSGSLLPSVVFHAGADIPIFLVYLSYVAR